MSNIIQTPDQQRAELLAKLQAIGGTSNQATGYGNGALSQAVNPAVLKFLGAGTGGMQSQAGSVLGGGTQQLTGLSKTLGQFGQGASILGDLAGIYLGFQAQKQAKKAFNFQKGAYNNNLVNSVKSYNTEMSDRIAARHNTEGRSQSETDSYLSENKLKAKTL